MNRLEAATKKLEDIYKLVREELSSIGFNSDNLTTGADLLNFISELEQEGKRTVSIAQRMKAAIENAIEKESSSGPRA